MNPQKTPNNERDKKVYELFRRLEKTTKDFNFMMEMELVNSMHKLVKSCETDGAIDRSICIVDIKNDWSDRVERLEKDLRDIFQLLTPYYIEEKQPKLSYEEKKALETKDKLYDAIKSIFSIIENEKDDDDDDDYYTT